jgi:hypothetical protein
MPIHPDIGPIPVTLFQSQTRPVAFPAYPHPLDIKPRPTKPTSQNRCRTTQATSPPPTLAERVPPAIEGSPTAASRHWCELVGPQEGSSEAPCQGRAGHSTPSYRAVGWCEHFIAIAQHVAAAGFTRSSTAVCTDPAHPRFSSYLCSKAAMQHLRRGVLGESPARFILCRCSPLWPRTPFMLGRSAW